MKLLMFFLSLWSVSAWAAGGGHHAEGVPAVVLYQVINVTILFTIIYFATRKKIPAFFAARYESFVKQAREAERIKKDLEARRADLDRRTENLRKTAIESVANSEKEAETMYQSELNKARESAQRILKDVNMQLSAEEQKLAERLRLEALEQSVTSAEKQLRETGDKVPAGQGFHQRVEGANL